jgi:hypothetical protein
MSDVDTEQQIDFTVDKSNLYREESITDLKVASIRHLIPVKPDGTDDSGRRPIFVGRTQLMTPEGPLPIHSKLSADSLQEAMDEFPKAMKQALAEAIERLQKMQQQQQRPQSHDSRIIVPGR